MLVTVQNHVVRESVSGGTKKGGTLDSLEEMEFCLAAKQGFKLKTKIKQGVKMPQRPKGAQTRVVKY